MFGKGQQELLRGENLLMPKEASFSHQLTVSSIEYLERRTGQWCYGVNVGRVEKHMRTTAIIDNQEENEMAPKKKKAGKPESECARKVAKEKAKERSASALPKR